jgi:ribosome biogenesis GTPase
MKSSQLNGLVVRQRSGFYTVAVENKEYTCQIRGRLKRGVSNEDLVAVGDKVFISVLPDQSGVVESIQPRAKAFFRMAPSTRGEYKQIFIANPDQVLLVFSCAEPDPSLRMLDRFLVIAEKQGIPAIVVANKTDLTGLKKARELFSIYSDLDYRVIYVSAKKGTNIAELGDALKGKLSALSGPSGVGKSSLLNRLQPELGIEVGSLRQSSGKGRHTTVVRQLFKLDCGGYVADMPGLRSLSLWDTQPEELDGYFPEMRDLVANCQFNNCSHTHEPGCAIKQAVVEGKIHASRYDSYIRLRSGDLPG